MAAMLNEWDIFAIAKSPMPCWLCQQADGTHDVMLRIPGQATLVVVDKDLCECCAEDQVRDIRNTLPSAPPRPVLPENDDEIPF